MVKSIRESAGFSEYFDGLQIWWEDDDEVECLGSSVLFGDRANGSVAASCSTGKRRTSYLYPVDIDSSIAHRRVISYLERPRQWPNHWELYTGDLIIDFDQVSRAPKSVSYRYRDTGATDLLAENVDWVYSKSTLPPLITGHRGKVGVFRLDRSKQALLRSQLLAEIGHCQITGTKTFAALEAAHIVPVKERGLDVVGNALLLRKDLHALFDAKLITFREDNGAWVVYVKPEVEEEDLHYRELHKLQLRELIPAHSHFLRHRTKLDEAGTETATADG